MTAAARGAAPAVRAARTAVTALLVALALACGAAWAQGPLDPLALTPVQLVSNETIGTACGDDRASVEILGLGRAVYDRIEFDGATGSGRLWGGVCIEVPEADAVLRAHEVRLSGVDVDGSGGPPPELFVDGAVLDLPGWRLAVGRLEGPIDRLHARDVHLIGDGLIGTAVEGELGLEGGTLRGVTLVTAAWRFEAERLDVTPEELTLTAPVATPCLCDAPRYRIAGRTAVVALDGSRAELVAPRLLVGGGRVPLGERVTLDADEPGLASPLVVETRSGLGTVIALAGDSSEGARFELGTASEPSRGPLTTLAVRDGGARVDLAYDPRGLQVRFRSETELGSGFAATGFAESDLRGNRGLLRSGGRLAWSSPSGALPLGEGGPTLTANLHVGVGTELAAEPRLSGGPVGPSGLRLPGWSEARLRLPVDRFGRFELRAAAEGAYYPRTIGAVRPGAEPTPVRASFTLAPSWTTEGGGARLRLAAERRYAVGESPYAFDATRDRFRLSGEASWRFGPEAFQVDASARAEWRLPPEEPGAETLTARLAASVPVAPGVTVTPSLRTELAGLFGGAQDRDWWEAAVRLRTPGELEADVATRFGLRDGAVRAATASARVPFDVPLRQPDPNGVQGVRLAPYLKLDGGAWLRGEGPLELAEHGVRMHLRDCCGTFMLGYLATDDGVGVEVGFTLPGLWGQADGPPGRNDLPVVPGGWPGATGSRSAAPGVR